MRRAITVLLTAALTTGGIAALAPSASAADIQPRDLTITVTNLGPEHRTCRIDADLYVPVGVNSSRRAPALLATNGFGGTKEDQADLAQGFGEQGYVRSPTPASGSWTATTARSPSTIASTTAPRRAS